MLNYLSKDSVSTGSNTSVHHFYLAFTTERKETSLMWRLIMALYSVSSGSKSSGISGYTGRRPFTVLHQRMKRLPLYRKAVDMLLKPEE
ncbi:hypothetical protein OK016_21590 [Vibrio chagasii]|nr:hypothetical protein [Vibrio chagasii]